MPASVSTQAGGAFYVGNWKRIVGTFTTEEVQKQHKLSVQKKLSVYLSNYCWNYVLGYYTISLLVMNCLVSLAVGVCDCW